ncbi:MAG: secretin N-terminal domain-containing protein [Planctomycetota bacterium]|jgi:general secretion pathway protein D
MERSKSIISIIVGLAAVLIIWRVGFQSPIPAQPEEPAETEVAVEPNEPFEVQKPTDANELVVASDANEPEKIADFNEPETLAVAAEPNEPMESVNLKNVEMKSIVQKLAEWTGKVIIPADEALKQKVTIYAPEKLPRSKALAKIYSALRMKGYVAEETDGTIYLIPITQAKLGEVPTITDDYPMAMIENKDQVVQKFFQLDNYSPSQMGQIIMPLIGEYGYLSADESTGSLLVIDTVKSLMRIGLIVKQYDIVEAEEIETEIFEIQHGNPAEIVELLERLLSGGASRSIRGPGRGSWSSTRPSSENRSSSRGDNTPKTATSVTVGTSRTPAVLIAEPTYNWIIAKATAQDMEQIAEWIKKLDRSVPTILVDYPLARIENKNQIVQKFFKLESYSSTQMGQVVSPLLSDSGYVSADENTRTLLVIDTVENLIRIEGIIAQFDVPEAELAVTDIFEIRYGDPSEIVQMLKILLGESEGYSASRSRSSYDRDRYGRDYNRYSGSSSRSSSRSRSSILGSVTRTGRSGGATSVMVGTARGPVILIPEPRRKWIIAKASAEDMKQIDEWIEKLDMEEPVEADFEIVQIRYADALDIEESVARGFRDMPGMEFMPSVLVESLEETRQVAIFGRKDLREIVKKMIAEIDVPPGLFETVHFKLKHADPDEVKLKLDELYEEQMSSSRSSGYDRYRRRGSSTASSEMIKVISYVALREVTVIASPENMREIRKRLEGWDVPLDVEALRPRIIELKNVDPVQMAELLRTLFSEGGSSSSSRTRPIYRTMIGSTSVEMGKIVGPLHGQLTFEEVPGTKKIIVISNIAEAYDVVENLIHELDSEEMAEVPRVIALKYADPEELSQILNVMFSEEGTSARIELSETGLSEYSMEESETTTQASTAQDEFTPWWSGAGARSRIDEEMPISNVIGRIRFVPDARTKSILVLAPPEFMSEIEKLIQKLDQPSKQVMIKAIILQIQHDNMTSLGVQYAPTDSAGIAFGTLDENTATIVNQLEYMHTAGSFTFNAIADVTAMVDFLTKTNDAQILNQQTLWTEDNEEASFFKGDKVAFFTSATTSATAGNVQNTEFSRVGMTLAVRPSITPEKNVDMIINIILSQLTSEEENGQPVRTEMETKTNMIIEDGQTIMLGGILFQEDRNLERKVPLLGDVPVVGELLFSHNETVAANNEMIVFITPYVIDDPNAILPATREEMERPKEKLENIREQLDITMKGLEQ